MIALHGTDPASVYLAAWARSADGHRAIGHAAVERALYQDQELLRMLGMRRTMFVVPAGLAPVIQAACTDQIAERMRRGLIRDLAAAGVGPDTGRWLDEVGAVQGDHGRRHLGGRLRPGRCCQEVPAGQPGSPLGHRSQGPCSH